MKFWNEELASEQIKIDDICKPELKICPICRTKPEYLGEMVANCFGPGHHTDFRLQCKCVLKVWASTGHETPQVRDIHRWNEKVFEIEQLLKEHWVEKEKTDEEADNH